MWHNSKQKIMQSSHGACGVFKNLNTKNQTLWWNEDNEKKIKIQKECGNTIGRVLLDL